MTYIFIVRQIKDHIQCLTMYHLTEKHLDLVFFFFSRGWWVREKKWLSVLCDRYWIIWASLTLMMQWRWIKIFQWLIFYLHKISLWINKGSLLHRHVIFWPWNFLIFISILFICGCVCLCCCVWEQGLLSSCGVLSSCGPRTLKHRFGSCGTQA